jgi:DNA helicase-2/ATP-dependent DNA helicase PcrA
LKLNSGTKQKIQDFVTMIQSFQVINENQDAFLYDVCQKTGLTKLKKDATPEGMAKSKILKSIKRYQRFYRRSKGD